MDGMDEMDEVDGMDGMNGMDGTDGMRDDDDDADDADDDDDDDASSAAGESTISVSCRAESGWRYAITRVPSASVQSSCVTTAPPSAASRCDSTVPAP